MHMHMRLTCNNGGPRTSGTSAVARACWRINVGYFRWEGGKGHMRNSAGHSGLPVSGAYVNIDQIGGFWEKW